ncbi:MAG: rhombotarget lipoprotein [Pseudomonadota bacterium]
MLWGALCATGCALLYPDTALRPTTEDGSQSVRAYLYGDDRSARPRQVSETTELRTPLRVGLAFVPATGRAQLPARSLQRVLEDLADAFRDRPYVASVVVLPDNALQPSGGFDDLSLASLVYNIDVIALIGYEQLGYFDDRALSLFDLSVVGAFLVPGHARRVETQLYATVLHLDSRRFLFTASGGHSDSEVTTLVHAREGLRTQQVASLAHAASALAEAADQQLQRLGERLTQDPTLQLTGAGSLTGTTLLCLVLILTASRRFGRPPKAPPACKALV